MELDKGLVQAKFGFGHADKRIFSVCSSSFHAGKTHYIPCLNPCAELEIIKKSIESVLVSTAKPRSEYKTVKSTWRDEAEICVHG